MAIIGNFWVQVAALSIVGLLAVAVLGFWLQRLLGIRCYCCPRVGVLQMGDYYVCRKCWDTITSSIRRQDAIMSSVADEEIREYYRKEARRGLK